MSSHTNRGRSGSKPSEPGERRQDSEEVRDELADTVNALTDKADVRSPAQDKTQKLKAQATKKAQKLKGQVMEKPPKVRARR